MNEHDETYDDLDELPAPPRKSIPEADRQLLELAARALGAVRFEEVEGEGYANLHFEDGRTEFSWNPLQFSGDALELAVKLNLSVSINHQERMQGRGMVVVMWDDANSPDASLAELQGDPLASTCRAIVRAAAAIGSKL